MAFVSICPCLPGTWNYHDNRHDCAGSGQNSYGGTTDGVFVPGSSTDTAPAYPASGNCTYAAEHPQNPPSE